MEGAGGVFDALLGGRGRRAAARGVRRRGREGRSALAQALLGVGVGGCARARGGRGDLGERAGGVAEGGGERSRRVAARGEGRGAPPGGEGRRPRGRPSGGGGAALAGERRGAEAEGYGATAVVAVVLLVVAGAAVVPARAAAPAAPRPRLDEGREAGRGLADRADVLAAERGGAGRIRRVVERGERGAEAAGAECSSLGAEGGVVVGALGRAAAGVGVVGVRRLDDTTI